MSKVLQNALVEHSAILLTCTKLPLVFKTFVLSIFEWPLKTGFTVNLNWVAYVAHYINPDQNVTLGAV